MAFRRLGVALPELAASEKAITDPDGSLTVASLVSILDELLDASAFADVALNGLQVAGTPNSAVRRLAYATTANLRTIRSASEGGAQCLLVHHGLLWPDLKVPIQGVELGRLEAISSSGLSLIAYHLPLDAHSVLGNSAGLLNVIVGGAASVASWMPYPSVPWLRRADCELDIDECLAGLYPQAARTRLSNAGHQTISVATGKGDSALVGDVGLSGDLFVTGELSLGAFERAIDEGRHAICIGHHSSELHGVRQLAKWVSQSYNVEVFDVDSPVPI